MSNEIRNPITGKTELNWYHENIIVENGVIVKCPKCGSTNVTPVMTPECIFVYIKVCKDCGKEFMSNEHN